MPDRYRFEWSSKGNRYRVDIYPPGATPVGSGVQMLPFDCIRALKTVWDYGSKVPYSMASPVRCTATFDCTLIPTELIEWLTVTKEAVTAEMRLTNSSSDVLHEVTARVGAVLEWSVDLNTAGTFKRVWMGVASVGLEAPIDSQTAALEVEFADLVQTAAKALTIDDLRRTLARALQLNQSEVTISRSAVIDWVWRGDTTVTNWRTGSSSAQKTWFIVAHIGAMNDDYQALDVFWAVKAAWVHGLISTCLGRMANAIARITPANAFRDVNLDAAMTDMVSGLYRQSYDAEPVAGAALANLDLHYVAVCARNSHGYIGLGESYDEWVRYTMLDQLVSDSRTLYDWMLELASGRFKQWCVQYAAQTTLIAWVRARNPLPDGVAGEVAVTDELRNPKVIIRGDVVTKVDVTTEVAPGGNDVDKRTYQSDAAFSDGPLQVAVTIDTSAVCHSRWRNVGARNKDRRAQDKVDMAHFNTAGLLDYSVTNGSSFDDQWPGVPPRMLGVYYIANPSDGSATPTTAFNYPAIIRCHEHQPFVRFGEADTPPVTMPYTLPLTQFAIGGDSLAIAQQMGPHGAMSQLGERLFATYYDDRAAKIECEADVTLGQAIVDGEAVMIAFHANACTFDLSGVDRPAWLDALGLPDRYWVAACEADWCADTTKLTLWGRP